MVSNQTSACWTKCGEEVANHTHVFWACPRLDKFWRGIFDQLDRIVGQCLPRDPLLAILGVFPEAVKNRKMKYLLHILLTAAKTAITLRWL